MDKKSGAPGSFTRVHRLPDAVITARARPGNLRELQSQPQKQGTKILSLRIRESNSLTREWSGHVVVVPAPPPHLTS